MVDTPCTNRLILWQLGPKYSDFLNGHRKIKIQIRVSPNRRSANKGKKSKHQDDGISAARQDYPQSTNVSSPVQEATKRRNIPKAKVSRTLPLYSNGYPRNDCLISDNENSLYEPENDSNDGYQPMSELQQKRRLGPPITTDKRSEGLDPTHRYVVEDFMVQAARESEHVRSQPSRVRTCLVC